MFSEDYASFKYASITFMKALMGDFDFEITAHSQHNVAAPIIMGAYVIVCVYFLLSIFVAILSDSFVLVSNHNIQNAMVSDKEAERRVSARAIFDVQRSLKRTIWGVAKKPHLSEEEQHRVDILADLFAKHRARGLRQGMDELRSFSRSKMQIGILSPASAARAAVASSAVGVAALREEIGAQQQLTKKLLAMVSRLAVAQGLDAERED